MARDIFDLSDLSDVPEALRPKTPPATGGEWAALLLEAGRPISPKQLQIAHYRKTGALVKSQTVFEGLRYAVRVGRAIRVGRGLYTHRDHHKQAAE